jgi:V/A-type H+-transporting ATPase subunit E
LLEKINREGVEKAEAEAAKIIAEAKAKADVIVKEAAQAADKTLADAEKNAAAFAERAAESVCQAARDTVISVRDAVTAMLEKLLASNVKAALADEKTAAALAAKALEDLCAGAEVSAAAEIADALKAQLAARGEIKVVTDETVESGFSVKIDNGRIEHSFTGEVIAGELAKRLRSDLAALLK